MTAAQRIQYHRYGGPEVLRLEEFEPAEPKAREILVRVRAAAANPMDWMFRNGDAKFMTVGRFPRGLGHDFSGVVETVGEGVMRFAVGDEVLGATMRPGTFAELVTVKASWVVKKPAGLPFDQAAAIPIVGATAFHALIDTGRLQAGQSVFVTGCLGGVGRAATQIALQHGATVGGSCRSTARQDALELGIDPVVDFVFDPEPLRGRFDIVFDTAGTLPYRTARALLKPGGRIVDIKPTLGKFLRSVMPGPYTLGSLPGGEVLEEVARAAEAGVLSQPIARTVPLAEAIRALTQYERTAAPRGGKLIVTNSERP